jgi:hypothetical protein
MNQSDFGKNKLDFMELKFNLTNKSQAMQINNE